MCAHQTFGQIIFLNGTSSSGKTSIATELEKMLGYQIASFDNTSNFAHLLPTWRTPSLDDYVSSFHYHIHDLVLKGRRVIVDHVLQESVWARECSDLFIDYSVLLVGVKCPLDILEQREKKRPERKGNARYQFDRVHACTQYDLEVDTSKSSLSECAEQIIAHLRAGVLNPLSTSDKFYR